MTDQANTTVSDERLAMLLGHEEAAGPLRGSLSASEMRLILTELQHRRATADVTEAMVERLAFQFQSIMSEALSVDAGEIMGTGPASFAMARKALAAINPPMGR